MAVKEIIVADLHQSQSIVFENQARFRVLVAGRRYGKTTLAINELLHNACAKNESSNWYLSPTYRQSKMIAWKMLLKLIPPFLISKKPNETDLVINLINGSEICLKGADNPDSLRGVGISFVVLDEYASMKADVWQEIIRPMLTDTKGKALFIGTPKGKDSFWDLWMKGQRKEDDFMSWQFKTIDNPYIDPQEIELAKQQMNERYYRQEYEASFEDYTGLIYPEFNEKMHVIEPKYIPDFYPRICSIDPAISGTNGIVFGAIDEDDNIIIYDELYERDKRVSDISQMVHKKSKVDMFIIDPASKAKNIQKEGKLYSLYDEYIDYGIVARAGEHDVNAGLNRVGEYFKSNKIKIFSNCTNLIWELERYHWSEERETIAGVLKPAPFKKDDHLLDALRYLIMSRTQGNIADTREPIEPGSLEYYIQKEQQKNERVFH